jgi:ankyrin repeat protein
MDDINAKKLIDAIYENDTATVSSFISSSSGSVNLNGKPWPLDCAAGFGRVEIMTMLLDAGVCVDDREHTACHRAVQNNQFDALKLLVERGAHLGGVDCDGHSLLSVVAKYGKSEQIAILLLDAGAPLDGLSPFHLMELVKSVAVFNRLMARGVVFNFTTMRDDLGCSLCHHVACHVKCENDFRFLVNFCGKDAVHGVDNGGKTPLHWASLSGNDLAVRVLVELGAEIDRQDNDGLTALFAANVMPQQLTCSCVELLLALGADVRLVANAMTAAHFAAREGKRDSLCALVAAGGDLEQHDNNGKTPRTIAAERHVALPTVDEIEAARRRIAKTRLDLVRERAFQICLGLQPLDINALQLCEIMMHSFGAVGSVIAFHQWWAIAVKVKHFRDHNR